MREFLGFPDRWLSSGKKNPPANAGDASDAGWIPGSERSPGRRNGNPLQYSCLENPIDRGAWRATVHGIAKSWTRLSMHAQASILSSISKNNNSFHQNLVMNTKCIIEKVPNPQW